jgi:hypothetical protein
MHKRIGGFLPAVAAVALGALGISQVARTHSAGSIVNHQPIRHVQESAAVLYRRFSILDSAAASSNPLPAATAAGLTEPGTHTSEYQLKPTASRHLDVNGTDAWVVPGQAGICLVVRGAEAGSVITECGALSTAVTKGFLLVMRASSGPMAFGLVPDGDSVTVAKQDDSSSNVPVANNFFRYSGPALSVSIRDANGGIVRTAPFGRVSDGPHRLRRWHAASAASSNTMTHIAPPTKPARSGSTT